MQLKLYSLLFVALELALLATNGMAYYDDDYELASRELGLDGFAHHYLRESYDSDLSHVATRDLVIELEERLVRRGGSGRGGGGGGGGGHKHKGADWSKLSVEELQKKLGEITEHLKTAPADKQAKLEKQIAALHKLISKKGGGSTGGGAGGGAAAAKANADSAAPVTDPNDPTSGTPAGPAP